jgi:hypothetical protein
VLGRSHMVLLLMMRALVDKGHTNASRGTATAVCTKAWGRPAGPRAGITTHLLAGGHGTSEHTSEGHEATLVAGGNHLGDVHHQRTIRVAVPERAAARAYNVSTAQCQHSPRGALPLLDTNKQSHAVPTEDLSSAPPTSLGQLLSGASTQIDPM